MLRDWLQGVRKYLVGTCATLAFTAGTTYAADNDELLQRLDQQSREIQELKARLDAQPATPLADKAGDGAAIDAKAVQNIVADYLKDHPGAGMPSGVQTGWSPSKGFYVDSPPNPTYANWQDESKIPFELRIRGRIQGVYDFYKVTDSYNHQTNQPVFPTNANITGLARSNTFGDFSQAELKRVRIIFEGTAFDPNLRYQIQLDGNTRGIANTLGNNNTGSNGLAVASGTTAENGAGLGAVDHAVRLFGAYIAYDWHPCCGEKGCGVDCCDGSYKYTPTVTFIAGKFKPYFSFEEVIGSANEQFVEYAMSEWYFDTDGDNLQTQAGIEAKALEDRLFVHATLNNAYENQTPNNVGQRLPAANVGFWYDFGGNWNDQRKKWDLYGDSISDIDYSCKPVLRVGSMCYLVPGDRRSQYTSSTAGFIRVATAAPGGTSMLSLFNNSLATGAAGPNALDAFDTWNYEAFWALHYRGFSLLNDWWVRDINNFRGVKNPGGSDASILYAAPALPGVAAGTALLPNHAFIDYGMSLQAGYFIVPKKWEVAARWSMINGTSGDIYGNGTFTTVTAAQAARLPGVPVGTRIYNSAFNQYHESDELAIGLNYYWKRQLLKWQTDLSYYTGGNPAASGASPAGYISGVNGYMIRTQIQLAF
jgi:hypothetical protein